MKSSDQVARVLALIPYLLKHPGVRMTEAAAAFGVSAATIRSDIRTIHMVGLPGGRPDELIDIDIDAVDDEGVIFLSNADYLQRPLRLTPDEALSLVLALRVLADVASEETAAIVASALAKLEPIVGAAVPQLAAITVAAGAAEVRQRVATAVEEGQRLRLTYDGTVRGTRTQPEVDPLRIVVRDGLAYLEAWSLDRQDWRMYRLERIVAAEPTGAPAEEHADPPPREAGWLDRLGEAAEVVVELAPAATWITEYFPIVASAPHGDGLRVTLRVADPVWLRGLLLRLGGEARVISPPDAGSSAAAFAREALETYRAAGLE